MTIPQVFLDSIYTSKDARLTAYNVGKFEVLKPCLLRYNKGSKNGIAITVVDAVSTAYSSKVSKSGAEKGVKSVTLEAGGTILFDINASSEKDGKPSEEAKVIETVIQLLKTEGIQEGEIFLAQLNFAAIPPVGMDEMMLTYYKEKGKMSTMFQAWRFTTEEELQAHCTELGLDFDAWLERFCLLSGNEFKEQAAYSRKGYGDLLKERVEFYKTIDPALKADILALTTSYFSEEVTEPDGSDGIETTETVMDWGNFVRDCLTSI